MIWLLLMILPAVSLAQFGAVEVRLIDAADSAYVYGATASLVNVNRTVGLSEGRFRFDSVAVGIDTFRVKALGYYPHAFPIRVRADSVIEVEISFVTITGYPDPGWCGTIAHAYPPPDNYDLDYVTIRCRPMRGREKTE